MGDKMYLYGYCQAYWYTAKCLMICKLFVTPISTLLIEYQCLCVCFVLHTMAYLISVWPNLYNMLEPSKGVEYPDFQSS